MAEYDQSRFLRHIYKPHLDLRGRFQHRRRRLDCARVLALLAVGQAHGRADFVLRDVLEFLQVLAGVVDVGRLLVGARQSELGGGVQRVELQGVLKGLDGLRKLLGLHIRCAQKIPGVGIVRIDFDYVIKGINRRLRVSGILREQAEVVPGMWILGILLQRVFERGLGFVDFLQVQEGDAFIQARDRQFRDRVRPPAGRI